MADLNLNIASNLVMRLGALTPLLLPPHDDLAESV